MKEVTIQKANQMIKYLEETQDKLHLFGNNIPLLSNREDNDKIEAHILNLHREIEMLQDRLLIAGRKEVISTKNKNSVLDNVCIKYVKERN